MLSDELEALSADVITLFGVSLKTGAIVRKLRRFAKEARELEGCVPHIAGALAMRHGHAPNVTNLEHARRQKRLGSLAKPVGGNSDRDN